MPPPNITGFIIILKPCFLNILFFYLFLDCFKVKNNFKKYIILIYFQIKNTTIILYKQFPKLLLFK